MSAKTTDSQNLPPIASGAATWTPTADQRNVIEEFAGMVEKEKSQAEFCRLYLPYGENKLGQILRVLDSGDPDYKGSYFDRVADPAAVVDEIRDDIKRITDAEYREAAGEDARILPITALKAVLKAVKECRGKSGPERLVKFISPSGGGKSIVCRRLEKEYGARVVEARDGWQTSYYTFLTDICRALRVRINSETSPSVIETTLIESVKNKSLVLVIDEGEFFGRRSLNGLKLLLNKTRLAVVICAIPRAHDKWNQYYPDEALQISRRTHAIIEQAAIKPDDAGLFFPANQFKDREKALAYAAGEASAFGHFSYLNRLAAQLAEDPAASADTVKKSCDIVRRQMLRDPK